MLVRHMEPGRDLPTNGRPGRAGRTPTDTSGPLGFRPRGTALPRRRCRSRSDRGAQCGTRWDVAASGRLGFAPEPRHGRVVLDSAGDSTLIASCVFAPVVARYTFDMPPSPSLRCTVYRPSRTSPTGSHSAGTAPASLAFGERRPLPGRERSRRPLRSRHGARRNPGEGGRSGGGTVPPRQRRAQLAGSPSATSLAPSRGQ